MSRTRKTPNNKGVSPTNSEGIRTPEPTSGESNNGSPVKSQEDSKNLHNKRLSEQLEEQLIITSNEEIIPNHGTIKLAYK